jgi:hypothetical protein
MNSVPTEKISAIIRNEEELELVITQLIAESVARADISIQGSAEQLKNKYGVCFIDPKVIQDSEYPAVNEPFLNDDFGWVVGLSFAIPLFICLIIGIFIIGDIRSTSDIWLYGILGAIIGSALGFFIAKTVKSSHDEQIKKQEKKGGYVIWILTHSKKQQKQVMDILNRHFADSIKEH